MSSRILYHAKPEDGPRFGWFSAKQAAAAVLVGMAHGYSTWLTTDGRKVRVSEVGRSATEPPSPWSDFVFHGEIVACVEKDSSPEAIDHV